MGGGHCNKLVKIRLGEHLLGKHEYHEHGPSLGFPAWLFSHPFNRVQSTHVLSLLYVCRKLSPQ